MPDPITGAVGAAVGSNVIGGIGARKAAKQQAKGQDQANALNTRMYEEGQNRISDFLGGADIGNLRNLLGQDLQLGNKTYGDFYNDPNVISQTNMDANSVANMLSGTGALGTTAGNTNMAGLRSSNALNNLNMQQMNNNNALNNRARQVQEALLPININQGALGMQNTLGQNFAQTQGQGLQRLGAINAGKAAAPWQAAQGLLNTGLQAFAPQQMGGLNLFGG